MNDLSEKTLNSNFIFDGNLIKLFSDSVLLPNGSTATREWINHPGAAAVLPIINNNIILVKQFRYPIHQITLEIPAGKLDPNEDPIDCARRELAEETGYLANSLTKLTSIATTGGFSNEFIHLFLANDLSYGSAHPDPDEFINATSIPTDHVLDLIKNGSIIDAKSIIAILFAKFFFFLLDFFLP